MISIAICQAAGADHVAVTLFIGNQCPYQFKNLLSVIAEKVTLRLLSLLLDLVKFFCFH
jgi:hypothetical protein